MHEWLLKVCYEKRNITYSRTNLYSELLDRMLMIEIVAARAEVSSYFLADCLFPREQTCVIRFRLS